MSITTKIKDGEGGDEYAGVKSTKEYGNALKVFTFEGDRLANRAIFYFNPIQGVNMNINASLGGDSEEVFNGGDISQWTTASISGTWDFQSTDFFQSGSFSLNASDTVGNDVASFSTSSFFIDGFDAFTGFIYLDSFSNVGVKDITFTHKSASLDVSDELNLSNYINTDNLNTWMKFTIPVSDFNYSDDFIDEILVKTISTGGGPPPNYYLDELKFEKISGSLGTTEYKIQPPSNKNWEVRNFMITMVGPLDSTLLNSTLQKIPYKGFLNIGSLVNGITIQRQENNQPPFTVIWRDFIDILATPQPKNIITGTDGTNTWLRIELEFEGNVRLNGSKGDYIKVILNDDFSNLLFFKFSSIYFEHIPII